MLVGITENGYLKNIKVSENGEILTKSSGTQSSNIENTVDNPVPVQIIDNTQVKVVQTSDQEVVLNASILQLSNEATSIDINKKVTVISIANYSESDDITMTVKEKQYQIGSSLAIDFPINDTIENISLVSTGTDTKTQLVIKGVE